MKLRWRILIFVAPVIAAIIWKYTIVAAQGGDELKLISDRPAKMFDLSVDLVLVAASILLGVFLYTKQSGSVLNPSSGKPIKVEDILVCALVQFVATILIFAFVLGAPHIPGFPAAHPDLVTIWIPDLIGFLALLWVVVKLT